MSDQIATTPSSSETAPKRPKLKEAAPTKSIAEPPKRFAQTLKRQRLIQPRTQGDNDGLCALYSVLNGIRLALHRHRSFTSQEEAELWSELVAYSEEHWGLHKLFLDGTNVVQTTKLSRLAAQKASELTRHNIVYKRITQRFYKNAKYKITKLAELLDSEIPGPMLIGIESEDYSHWTIAERISKKCIFLFDSYNRKHLRIGSCRISSRKNKPMKTAVLVRIYGTFHVTDDVYKHP